MGSSLLVNNFTSHSTVRASIRNQIVKIRIHQQTVKTTVLPNALRTERMKLFDVIFLFFARKRIPGLLRAVLNFVFDAQECFKPLLVTIVGSLLRL